MQKKIKRKADNAFRCGIHTLSIDFGKFVVAEMFLTLCKQILLLTKQFVQWNETVTRLEAAAKPPPSVD